MVWYQGASSVVWHSAVRIRSAGPGTYWSPTMDNPKRVQGMGAEAIAAEFERASQMQMQHEAITYEHGVMLVNIVCTHGTKLADLLRDGLKYREAASAIVDNR